MNSFLLGLIIVVAIVSLFYSIKAYKGFTESKLNYDQLNQTIANFSLSLQNMNADVAERISRLTMETRQELTDRLNTSFDNVRNNLLSIFNASFESMLNQLKNSREELTKNLNDIRDRVDEKLLSIGQQVQGKLDENIREGFKHFEKVQEHLNSAAIQLQNLNTIGNSVNELNNLLKLPHLRGSFGEMTLERLLTDFLPAEMWERQAKISEDSKERADAIIKFPDFKLPIDSKFPREKILPLFESSNEEDLKKAREELARITKLRANEIAKYIKPENGTTDMALMFLPSETLYFEIIRNTNLLEDLAKIKIYPVSPNTFAITLKAISIAYQYYQTGKNLQNTMKELQKAQSHYENFKKRFEEIGKEISRAQEAFQKASTHLTRYSSSISKLTGETLSEAASLEESVAESE